MVIGRKRIGKCDSVLITSGPIHKWTWMSFQLLMAENILNSMVEAMVTSKLDVYVGY